MPFSQVFSDELLSDLEPVLGRDAGEDDWFHAPGVKGLILARVVLTGKACHFLV